MSWDRPWEPTPEMRERERERERRRQERLNVELIELARDLGDLKDRATNEAQTVAHMQQLLERKRELLADIRRAQRRRTEAEKATRAAERALEFERRRAERLGHRTEGPRNGRPVRIKVDDGAWEVLRREAISRRWSMIGRIGELVRTEVEAVEQGSTDGPPSSRRRRSPGEAEPTPRQRFLRVRVDGDTWTAVRLLAARFGLTTARYLGEIAEAEARGLGWRSAHS